MMDAFPYSYLEIPEKCLIEKRVYKKLFFENAKLTVTDKKWFTKDIENIVWAYSLKPNATLIHALEEEHYTYDEIAVIEFELRNDHHVNRLADIIHRVIPYPLLIVFKKDDWVRLSVADKRFNLADNQAATLQEKWVTERLYADGDRKADKLFLEQLNYQKQPRLNLKVFYRGWIDAFISYKVSHISGVFEMPRTKQKKQKLIKALNRYRNLEQQIADLRTELKKQDAFNDKVRLNVDIKELEKQLKKTAKQL
jgi:hypothetical protein